MLLKIKNEKIILFFFYVFIFFAFLCFYTKIEPIMVCDTDDWTYISYIRVAYPRMNLWNPARILPETFMGWCGDIAAFVIYPLLGDYQRALTFVFGFVVSVFVIIYLASFLSFIQSKFHLDLMKEIFVGLMFLAMHFLIFKSQLETNLHMLTAINLTCFMFYLVPALICCSLALLVLKKGDLAELYWESSNIKKGIMILLAYIAIFSNLAVNVLFVFAVGVVFLRRLTLEWKKRGKNILCKEFWVKGIPYWIVFGMELTCMGFELRGNRAQSLEFEVHTQLSALLSDIRYIWGKINKEILLAMIIVIVAAIVFALVKSYKEKKADDFLGVMGYCAFCFVLCGGYMCCLMTRVGLQKFRRCENIFVVFFYFVITFAIALAYLICKIKWAEVFMPLILYVVLVQVISGDGHIYKSNFSLYGGNDRICREANQKIIEQFVEADQKGLQEIEIDWGEGGLGTLDFTGERISQTLYNHRIISRKIDVIN